jgi:hypothetical protein
VTKHFLRDRDRIDGGRENFIYYVDDTANPEPLPPELLNNRNLAQPLESYRSIEADIAEKIAARAKRTAKVKRAQVDVAPTVLLAGEDASDRTMRLKATAGVSAPVPPLSKDAPSVGESIDTQFDEEAGLKSDFVVRVITGPSAGREMPLSKAEQSIGRIGVGVAALKRVGDDVWLIPLEGEEAPRYNGAPISSQGAPIVSGDRFEVAGTELTLIRR